MYITLVDRYMDISSCGSKHDMLSLLDNFEEGNIILGNDAQQENEFYVIRIYSYSNKVFGIGIISEGHGLSPHMLVQSTNKSLLIGLNKEVSIIDCIRNEITRTIHLNSLFYSFIHLENRRIVLIIHETGVFAISDEGKELWKYDSDIINNYRIEGECLCLEFMDDDGVNLLLSNGKIS